MLLEKVQLIEGSNCIGNKSNGCSVLFATKTESQQFCSLYPTDFRFKIHAIRPYKRKNENQNVTRINTKIFPKANSF